MKKLLRKHSEELLSQPESGMGFQIIRARWSPNLMFEKNIIEGICFNAELFVEDHKLEKIQKSFTYEELLEEVDSSTEFLQNFKVLSSSEIKENNLINDMMRTKQLTEMLDRRSGEKEIFKRFSAYNNDRRVTSTLSLSPGTYATTNNDSSMVPSGLSAVGRYALPNIWPARYVFRISPSQGTLIKCGTVRPAFNQSGGGVEVLFVNGTTSNTVSNLDPISER